MLVTNANQPGNPRLVSRLGIGSGYGIPAPAVEMAYGDHGINYGHLDPPVFLGHYWLTGAPQPLESNVACLDYSVAKKGSLAAYCWKGEKMLQNNHLFQV